MTNRCFDRIHPVVAFCYFVAVLVVTMFSVNPIVIILSFAFGLLFCGEICGWGKPASDLPLTLAFMLLVTIVNPLFVHKGDTILFFLNDNPVTLEALLYGVNMSFMLAAVLYWCKSLTRVISADKVVYLFGGVLPKLSVVLNMAIGFIPRFKRRYNQISNAQKALGIYCGKGIVDKISMKLRVFGILLTDSLESGVITADSMRARGFGLKGRTNYSPYVFTFENALLLGLEVGCALACVVIFILGGGKFAFYPTLTQDVFGLKNVLLYCFATVLFAVGTICEWKEDIRWHYLKSTI